MHCLPSPSHTPQLTPLSQKDWNNKTPVPLRAPLQKTSPRNRRSLTNAVFRNSKPLLDNHSELDTMKHSFSTLDLAFDSDEDNVDSGPATFCHAGYDLHYSVLDSPNFYRVVSLDLKKSD